MLEHLAEINLASKLLQFVETISRELKPNALTNYLYEPAKALSRSYDRKIGFRIMDASPESVRTSRLRLCDLTAHVLSLGLHFLASKPSSGCSVSPVHSSGDGGCV